MADKDQKNPPQAPEGDYFVSAPVHINPITQTNISRIPNGPQAEKPDLPAVPDRPMFDREQDPGQLFDGIQPHPASPAGSPLSGKPRTRNV